MAAYIYTIDEIKRIAEPVARAYGIARLSLFGSYARGDAGQNSDIDIRIIDRGNLRGLIKLAGFNRELEERFGVKVDVVACDSSDNDFLNEIKNDEVIIYERTIECENT